jgi:hypothetical protein
VGKPSFFSFIGESKLFSNGEFARKCLKHIMQEMCSDKEDVFNIVGLFHQWQQVEDISSYLLNQVRKKAKEAFV